MSYAGFWKRLAAFVIDFIITMIGSVIIGIALGISMVATGTDDPETLEGAGNLLGILVMWVYFSVMESSTKQGTLGKMALGIKVTDLDGNRISFGRASGRYFGKIISWLVIFLGFIMIAFTKKKQGLHDMMAGCLVVNKTTA